MKKYWLVIQHQERGKYGAFVLPVTESDNIHYKLSAIPGIVSANIYNTKKEADRVVWEWFAGYRAAGCFIWDTMPDGSPAPF